MSQELEQFETEGIVYINDNLILKFLKVFSRAEYALKNVKKFRYLNKAEANWDKFANAIDSSFYTLTESGVVQAREYLWNNPPKKQRINNNELFFEDFKIDEHQAKTQQLLFMVRTVRNNLFHGGKHTPPAAEVKDAERNQKLLENSIIIIKACMNLDNHVRDCYNVQ